MDSAIQPLNNRGHVYRWISGSFYGKYGKKGLGSELQRLLRSALDIYRRNIRLGGQENVMYLMDWFSSF